MLERQINTRFPYRGKGPLDGIGADQVLRITNDPSRNGRFRSGPDLAALRAAVAADRRALSIDYLADAARTRYLAIAVKPAMAFCQDPSAWDLSRLDVAPSDTDTGSAEADQAWDGAKSGAAIGGTVGTVLEAVPAVGPVLHAMAVGIGAITGAIAGAFKDTFHPTPAMAGAWLALFHIYPPMIFSGVDTITASTGDSSNPAEEHAARLVRYFLLVSGIVRNTGELYNPNDLRNDNPYMARADRRYPLTNQHHLRNILLEMKAGRHVPSEISHARRHGRSSGCSARPSGPAA